MYQLTNVKKNLFLTAFSHIQFNYFFFIFLIKIVIFNESLILMILYAFD